MLAIKLKRVGKKHQATYRIVVQEKRSKVDGRFIDDLGWWDPHANKFSFSKDKAKHWLSVGAKPTATVHNFFVKAKIAEGTKKIQLHRKPAKKKKE